MVAIKSLAHLSLTRSSSQPAASRASVDSAQPSAGHLPNMTARAAHDDPYLSDNPVSHSKRQSSPRSGHIPISPTSDAGQPTDRQAPTTGTKDALNLIPLSASVSKPGTNTLVVPVKVPALASSTPIVPAISGLSTPPTTNQQGVHKLLISNLRSVSAKAITRAGTPLASAPPSPPLLSSANHNHVSKPIAIHQLEASYISKVGTRLRDLIAQVFPSSIDNGLVWMGRGAPRPTSVAEVGEALKRELEVCSSDSYIFRSLVRTAAIPALTVFAGRLDSLLILPANEPSVLYVPKSAKDVDHSLPVVLRYNIEVIRCAWVAYSVLGGIMKCKDWNPEVVKVLRDGLTPILSKMDAIIQRFMGPYLTEIKKQVTGCIMKSQPPTMTQPLPPTKPHHHLSLSRTIPSLGGYSAWISPAHPNEPLHELVNLLEGVRKLLMSKLSCQAGSHRWIVSVATQAAWKAMLVFSTWTFPLPAVSGTNQPIQTAPGAPSHTLARASAFKGARHILHPGKQSPPPPVKSNATLHHELMLHLKAFWVAINDFVKDVAGIDPNSGIAHSTCPRDCELCSQGFLLNPVGEGDLVREAMNEALEALSAFQLVASALLQPERLRSSLIAYAHRPASGDPGAARTSVDDSNACPTLVLALQELPPFILIHLLASRISKEAGFRLPHEVWGDRWEDYQEELSGFLAAEQWLSEEAYEMVKEVRRIQRLQTKADPTDPHQNEGQPSPPDPNQQPSAVRLADDMEWMEILLLSIQVTVVN